jgi:outer membrane biosynthesis protein TonB
MTTQPTRPTGGPGSHAPAPFRATRTATGVRGRAVLAALGLALAAAVLPATAVHASPQPPDIDNRFANPGGNPQPPEPPDPPQWGPQDLASPTEDPEPPLPPEPPDNGPDDEANPVDNPEPPPPPNPNPTSPADNPIPTPQLIDAGFGGTAAGAHHAAGLALIGAALVLAVLVAATARRHRSGAGSAR